MVRRTGISSKCSSETIVDRWNGIPFEKPLARVRETVTLVRAMLAGERSSFHGKTVRSEGFRLTALPPKPVPIYVTYLTALPTSGGEIVFHDDPYGRDGSVRLATAD